MDCLDGWLRFEGGAFDPLSGDLRMGLRTERLRPRTARVLACLLHNTGRVVGRDELMREVWPDVVVTDDSLAQCMKEIRRALGEQADRIRTVPRVGYAFIRARSPALPSSDPRPESDQAEAPVQAPRPLSSAPVAASAGTRRRRNVVLAALAALLLVGLGVFALAPWQHAPPRGIPMSLVVLPLQTVGGEATPVYLAEAITDELTTDLSRISGSFVIGSGTAARYAGKPVDPRQVGTELGVRYVVEGSVERSGEQVTLSLRLVDARDGRLAWSERVVGARSELGVLRDEVTTRIAHTLHLQLVDAEAQHQHLHPSSHPDAHDLTMQAWVLWQRQNREENLRARDFFTRALAMDPSSAQAWAGLGNTYITEISLDRTLPRAEPMRRAEQAAERAYRADPSHVNALGTLGTVRALQGRPEEALALFREQMRINPNYAPGAMWMARVLGRLGDANGAVEKAELAIKLSPYDPRLSIFYTVLADALLQAGQPQRALQAAERAVGAPRPYRPAATWLAAAALQAGDAERARRVMAEFVANNPGYTIATLREDEATWRPIYRERNEKILEAMRAAGLPER